MFTLEPDGLCSNDDCGQYGRPSFFVIQNGTAEIIMKNLGMEKVRPQNGDRGYRVYEYTFDEIKANKLCISTPEQAKLEF